ncbi:MAG: cation-transporting P-type ATPase [Nanoarchaeota archaeon]|nr:cation-transporting P-type ATPase [Nanoarchaeota archaeon]
MQTLKQIFKELSTSEKGLTQEEAKRRLTKYGTNTLKQAEQTSPFVIFLEQFHSPVLYTPLTSFFHTVPLSIQDWIFALGVASMVFVAVEAQKLFNSKHH